MNFISELGDWTAWEGTSDLLLHKFECDLFALYTVATNYDYGMSDMQYILLCR